MIETFKKYSEFQGTATRSEYWAVILVLWALSTFVFFITPFVVVQIPGGAAVGSVIFVAMTVLNVWVGLATAIRRCRDADITPWFVLTALVPYINFIAMIVFGCIPSKTSK